MSTLERFHFTNISLDSPQSLLEARDFGVRLVTKLQLQNYIFFYLQASLQLFVNCLQLVNLCFSMLIPLKEKKRIHLSRNSNLRIALHRFFSNHAKEVKRLGACLKQFFRLFSFSIVENFFKFMEIVQDEKVKHPCK